MTSFPVWTKIDFRFRIQENEGKMREIRIKTHAKFTIDNVDEAAGDYDEIEGIPSIRKIILVIPKLGVVVC